MLFFIFLLLLLGLGWYIIYDNIVVNDIHYISNDGTICKVIYKTMFYVTISTIAAAYDISIFEFFIYYRKYND